MAGKIGGIGRNRQHRRRRQYSPQKRRLKSRPSASASTASIPRVCCGAISTPPCRSGGAVHPGRPIARGGAPVVLVRHLRGRGHLCSRRGKSARPAQSLDRMMLSRKSSYGVHTGRSGYLTGDERPHHLLQVPQGPGPADGEVARIRASWSQYRIDTRRAGSISCDLVGLIW